MRDLYTAWQMMLGAAVSCASSGMSVVLITLAMVAWNYCRATAGHDNLAGAHGMERF